MANIYNDESNTLLSGTSGNDSIYNGYGSNVTINAGAGDDSIDNDYGSNVTINAGAGDDSIDNEGSNVSINGGDGDDTIYNTDYWDGSKYVGADNVTIDAGDGKDTIYNSEAANVTIVAGAGDDSILNQDGKKASISAGAGDDSISNGGSNVSINGGDGDDTIYNTSYWDDSKVGADNVTITAGAGDDSIYNNYGSNGTINAGAGDDEIYNNYGSNVSINGGDGKDSINNSGASVSVDAGDGNDYIYNWRSTDTTLLGGDGDDEIWNSLGSKGSTVRGGQGKDSIQNYGDTVTLNGGAGDDFINNHGSSNVEFKYASGDGYDTIQGFNATSTLQITGGTYFSQVSGSDIVVTVGDGKITLESAASLDAVNIDGEYLNPFLITLTDGNDSYSYSVAGATINALGGNDSIYGCSKDSKVDGGDGDDYIEHDGAGAGRYWGNNTLYGGAGNDTISNDCDNVTIDAGDGDDLIDNYYGSDVSIDSGSGNDTIYNYDSFVSINAGADNDYISTGRSNVTITAGAGDDSIHNSGSKILFTYALGDGNDSIFGFKANDTLSITGGTYSTDFVGDDLIVTVGKGKITLVGAASLSVHINDESINPLITLTEGNDSYSNSVAGATIKALGGNDSITNHEGSQVSINGGAGNDTIHNSGVSYNSKIDGGAGDDYISNNWGFRITVSGGAGSDSLQIIGGEAHSISGGAGDDYISNTGNATIYTGDGTLYEPTDILTISGGAGNDSISNTGAKILFQYASGDGNDLIAGFNATSTLQITGGTYSTDFVGDDLIVTVDKGKITLEGAASLESVNINDEKIFSYSWTLDGTVATYGSTSKTLATVSGVKSLNGISLSGKVVTVSKAALNAADISVSDGYTLKLASDVPAPTTAKATYSDGVYKTAGVSKAGYQLSGNSIRYVTADIKTIKFSGVSADATASNFYLSGNTITVGKAAVKTDGTALKLLTSGYTLKLGNGMAAPTTTKSWTLKNSAATYQQTTSAGYKLADNAISYSKAATKNLITVSGVKSLDGLKLSKKIVTVSAASLGTKDVSISDGYTLKLGSDVSKPSTSKAWSLDGTTAAYQQTTTAGYKLADNAISYSKAATKNLITVTGVKSLDGLKLSKKIVTVSAASLGTKDVSISDGYTLKLGSDVSKPSTSKAWSLDGTTAAYQQTTSAGYTLADNAISYSKAATKNLITVSGVSADATASNFYLSGNSITVGKAAVKTDGTALKLLTSGYTLKLGNGMAAPTTSKAWSLDGTTAAYQQTTTAGYTLADNSITYSKAATENLITVSGVKSLDGLKLSKKIVTVSSASLGTKDVSISDGYTLKLGSDVSKPSTSKAWSLDGTTAAYQQTTSAGYTLADNSITYSKKSSKTLVTVDGVDSLDGLKLSKKVVTVSAASLGTNDVSISDGYKLKLGKDVDAPTSKQAAWTLKKTTATYKSSSTTAGYTLEDNVIRYSKKKSAATLATIKGVENVDGLSISGKMISAEATALSKKVTVSSDDYGFDFGTDYKKARVTGSEFDDKIKSAGQRVTILGGAGDDSLVGSGKYSSLSGGDGKDTIISGGNGSTLNGGAGNDLLTGSDEEDIFVYAAGDGNDTITNYDTSDKISLASGAAKISVSLGAVVFKVGSGKLTLKNAADLKVTYVDADGTEHTYPEEQNPVEFNAKGTGATLTTAYTDETFDINGYRDYKDSVVTINASAVLHPLDITGNNLANVITGTSEDDYIYGEDGGDKIFGGEGNDSLWGGAGNDTLTGDSGSDVFIFYDGDGDDLIKDYESGVDTVMIMSGTVSNPIVDGRDVIFSVGDGQITFEDAASKPIVLVNRNGKQVGSHTPK